MLRFDASQKWPDRLISDGEVNNVHNTTRDIIKIYPAEALDPG